MRCTNDQIGLLKADCFPVAARATQALGELRQREAAASFADQRHYVQLASIIARDVLASTVLRR
jgi:hypothetical protein